MARRNRQRPRKAFLSSRQPSRTSLKSTDQGLSLTIQLALLVLACAVVYGATLDVPFYLDDFSSIRENSAIRDLGDLGAVLGYSPLRAISYFSFAVNFAVHEYSLAGYHLTNLAVHLGASVMVFLLARGLLTQTYGQVPRGARASSLGADEVEKGRELLYFPVLVALLFALHPLQTQAVTYVVQRSASLAALFYLLALLAYLQARISPRISHQVFYFGLCGLSTLLAIFSKQNTITIPLAIVFIELMFFNLRGQMLLRGFGILASLSLVGAAVLYLTSGSMFFQSVSEATTETTLVTRWQYFAIQMGVLWTYIAKFFFPYPLHLEYDIGVTTFAELSTQIFALMHLLVIAFGLYNIRKRPILAFGILFYYLAHSVESSIIPIRDFAFEHRTYLPNFGLSLVVAYGALTNLPKFLQAKQVAALISVVLLALMVLTIARNNLWRDPIAFYEHEIAVSPNALRPRNALGEAYVRAGDIEAAQRVFEEALPIIDTNFNRGNNTYVAFQQNYALVLGRQGEYERALALLDDAALEGLSGRNRASFLTVRGNIYATQLQLEPAETDFTQALAYDPNHANALLSLGKVQYMQACLQSARETFARYFEVDPGHPYRHEAEQILTLMDELERSGQLRGNQPNC